MSFSVSCGSPCFGGYESAKRFFEKTKPWHGSDERPLEKRTKKHMFMRKGKDGSFACYLHQTPCVTYFPNNEILLKTGGWSSVSTRLFIDTVSPWSTTTVNSTIFVSLLGGWYVADGLRVRNDVPINPERPQERVIDKAARAAVRAEHEPFLKKMRDLCAATTPSPELRLVLSGKVISRLATPEDIFLLQVINGDFDTARAEFLKTKYSQAPGGCISVVDVLPGVLPRKNAY